MLGLKNLDKKEWFDSMVMLVVSEETNRVDSSHDNYHQIIYAVWAGVMKWQTWECVSYNGLFPS